MAWGPGGLPVSGGGADQFSQEMSPQNAGAVTLVWLDRRNSSTPDLYAQRLDAAGTPQWTGDLALCTQPTVETQVALTRLDDDATAIAWRDTRSGTGDVYAHVVSAAGAIYGALDGDAASNAPGDQSAPALVGAGTQAIATWMDRRGASADIYAQRIGRAGPVSGVPPEPAPRGGVQVSLAAPNPTAGPATIRLDLPSAARVVTRVCDLLGRQVRSLGAGVLPAKVWTLTWDGLDERGRVVPAGLYLLVLDTPGQRFVRRVLTVR